MFSKKKSGGGGWSWWTAESETDTLETGSLLYIEKKNEKKMCMIWQRGAFM